jgi:hypothetical protein
MGFNIHILSVRNRSTNLPGHAALAASFNPPCESASRALGSLHEVAASSGLCAVTLQPGPHRWFFSTSGRGRRQQSGATLALTLRAAQCIKRRLSLQPKVARSPSWIRTRCIAEGRNARSLLNPPVHRPARSRLTLQRPLQSARHLSTFVQAAQPAFSRPPLGRASGRSS